MKTTATLLAGLLSLALLFPGLTNAQQVGIGTATPDPSAALDLTSTTGGLLPPRLTQAQRDAIAGPAAGLLVFNLDTQTLNLWDGTRWQQVLGTGGSPALPPSPTTFGYTGSPQTYTVPAGVTAIRVVADGATGAGNAAAARVEATLPVLPGEVLTVVVGGQGNGGTFPGTGGYNGGGTGYTGGGGGATDLRRPAANGLTGDYAGTRNALLVAGGSGGSYFGPGGVGGFPNGGNGANSFGALSGYGATPTEPGPALNTSSPGLGGAGGTGSTQSGGGGGGGYYGGGGGYFGGGGGGSSWVMPGASQINYSFRPTAGNGTLSITPLVLPAPTLSMTNVLDGWRQGAGGLFYNAGRVGIGTGSPAAVLHVAGPAGTPNVRLESLGGSGTRPVVADASGNLTTLSQQSGLVSIGSSSAAYEARTVTFPTPFSSPPGVVICTPRLDANGAVPNANLGMTAVVRNVSSTGFTVVVSRTDATVGWGTAVSVSWLAMP